MADRAVLARIDPMDARATIEGHEARLQRVRRSWWDNRARERAGPRFFRHIPRGIHLLPFDLVQTRGRFQAFHSHRDFVGSRKFQMFVEAQPECSPIEWRSEEHTSEL